MTVRCTGMRSESPVADGVMVSEPMRRSVRKSERTTDATESDAVVSTSKSSTVTGVVPRRPVVSSGSTTYTESTVVMESSAPVPLGWYDVANGACENIVTTDNANFYFYADSTDGSGRRWQGGHTLCVEYPGPYTFYSDGSTECKSWQELRSFEAFTAEEPGTWTWTLNP